MQCGAKVEVKHQLRRIILNFHGIGMPQRPLDSGERKYWISKDLFLECLNVAEALKEQVWVDYTFDDGNKSDLEIGAQALNDRGISAQIFVLSSRIDTPGSLSTHDIQVLQEMGHSVGLHGADHVDWTLLDADGQKREFDNAVHQLQDVLGQCVHSVAIPFGRYNRRVLMALRERGFTQIYSSDGGAWRKGQSPIPRSSITADMTAASVRELLLGQEPSRKRLRRTIAMAIKKRI